MSVTAKTTWEKWGPLSVNVLIGVFFYAFTMNVRETVRAESRSLIDAPRYERDWQVHKEYTDIQLKQSEDHFVRVEKRSELTQLKLDSLQDKLNEVDRKVTTLMARSDRAEASLNQKNK